ARSGGSHQEHEFPAGELDVEVLHSGALSTHVRLGDVVETDHGCLSLRGSRPSPRVGARAPGSTHLWTASWSKPGQVCVPLVTLPLSSRTCPVLHANGCRRLLNRRSPRRTPRRGCTPGTRCADP